jgi:hypothetical protein
MCKSILNADEDLGGKAVLKASAMHQNRKRYTSPAGLPYTHKSHEPMEGRGAAPSRAAGESRGGGEKHENKALVFLILNTACLTFPRCAGKGSTGSRYRLQSNGVAPR